MQSSISIAHPTQSRPARSPLLRSTPTLACLAALAAFALFTQAVIAVWQSGRYFDTDDAMRMVQVRDLLAGQGWYDLVPHRLNPPDGIVSHWSRIVDLPLAGLVLFFSWFTSRENAEILTRLTFPFLVHVAYFAALFALARRLIGDIGVAAVFFLAILCATTNLQFLPGRIDHHAPQIALLMLMALAGVRILSGDGRRPAWMLGALIAMSFAISIENMPFIGVLLATLALAWACGHAPVQAGLRPLGLSLLVFAPLAFAATVPPVRYFDAVADAFGIAHLTLLMVGGLLAVGAGTFRTPSPLMRWVWLGGAAAFCLAVIAALFPYLLHDPLTAVDPLVRTLWLARVSEALPLHTALLRQPLGILHHIVPLACGVIAVAAAVIAHRGDERWPWIAIAGLTVIGTLGALWQVRVATSTLPFAMIAGAWAIIAWHARLARSGGSLTILKPILMGFLFCVPAWQVLGHALKPVDPDAAAKEQRSEEAYACFEPRSFAALRDLPPQLLLASIDVAPHALAWTGHSVIAAPYHRNNRGNRLLMDVMTSDPDKAHALIEQSGARLIVFCPAATELPGYVKAAPHGFAAALLEGRTPSWLTPVGDPSAPLKLLAVK